MEFALRHIDDALGVRDYARHNRCQHAVVLGGGLLGLEAAHALTRIGLRTTVIDRNPWILNRQLDQDGGNLLIQILRELHLDVLLRAYPNIKSLINRLGNQGEGANG